MLLPNELAGLAPEADLRSIVIRRQDHRARADDAKIARTHSEAGEGLLFTKGLATAEGFRPSYWSYGGALDLDTRDACAGADVPAAVVAKSAAPREPSREDDEISALERAFLAAHHRALVEGQEPAPDTDGTPSLEMPVSMPGNSDIRAPAADLRTVGLRRSRGHAALSDGLIVRKSLAAADATPSRPMPFDDHAAVVEPSVEAFAAEAPTKGDDARGEGSPLAGTEVEDARTDDAESLNDAVPDAAFVEASRANSLPTPQTAILVFGCIALLASLDIFTHYSPPPPRETVAVEQQQAPAPGARPLSATVGDLLARGDDRLRNGDVFAARLFYQQAADAGSAHGALMVGATFDPTFLASIGARGLRGDEKVASAWYRRAGDLGDPGALKLEEKPQPQ